MINSDGVLDCTTNLIIVILIAVFLVGLGTVGYMIIEGWPILDSLYMTVITLSTIGAGEKVIAVGSIKDLR